MMRMGREASPRHVPNFEPKLALRQQPLNGAPGSRTERRNLLCLAIPKHFDVALAGAGAVHLFHRSSDRLVLTQA